ADVIDRRVDVPGRIVVLGADRPRLWVASAVFVVRSLFAHHDDETALGKVVALAFEIIGPASRIVTGERRNCVEAGQNSFIGVETRVIAFAITGVGRLISVANERGIVAGVARFERPVGMAAVERRAVHRDAMVVL